MTRTRALILGAAAVCVVIIVVAMSSGSDDGPRSFMAADSTGALLVEWTRVGDDVSGSLTQARLLAPTPVLLGNDALLREKPREIPQASSPFTGTVNGDGVRLQLAGSALGTRVNGQLDGDALKLIFTPDNGGGPETVRFNPASHKDFNATVARLRAADAARSRKATAARLRADATAKAEIRASRRPTRRRLTRAARMTRAGTCPRPRRTMSSPTRRPKRPPAAAPPSSASTSTTPPLRRSAWAPRRSTSERL